jgi:protein-S-isoprenylcysteine O-methyltransferase Ste14
MHYVAGLLLVGQFVLMSFLERAVSVRGLDYVAWAIWLVGIVLLFLPISTLRREGQSPRGQGYVATEVLVDSGIYALVRHPQYLGWMLMYLVVFLFSLHWIVGGVGVVGAACVYWFTIEEEKLLIAKFGEPYRSYMERVPRFNLLLQIGRLLAGQEKVQRRRS